MLNKILVIDGHDKVGKDTIIHNFIPYNIMCINRFVISQISYGRIYNRNLDEVFLKNTIVACSNLGMQFVYLYADEDITKQRFILHNETDLPIEDIGKHKKIFEEVISELENELHVNIIKVDTGKLSIQESIDYILERI